MTQTQHRRENQSHTPSPDAYEETMSIRSIIMTQIVEIAGQQKKQLGPLSDNLPLLESGLDSLCIAVLVATLDDRLGVDPFATDDSPLPVTVGQFISLYEHAAA
jgi:acyl carrier protein